MSARLPAMTSLRCASTSAKCDLRRLSKVVRAALMRFHSSCSVARSARGIAFHCSTMAAYRSAVDFQAVDVARDSASATRAERVSSAAARSAARRSRARSRAAEAAAARVSTRASKAATSPTKLRAARAARTLATTPSACSPDARPSATRAVMRSTSTTRSSYFRAKKARPSSGAPAAHWPTATSPSGARR